ncbi:MAG: hypothetical protein ACLRVT_07680, partial [Oscillospiraceae bacterium]
RIETCFNSHKGCRTTRPRLNYPHPGGRALGRNWTTVFMGEKPLGSLDAKLEGIFFFNIQKWRFCHPY